ncbi:MAG: zf-HC2 domain-containing protein, partial [Nitrospira sp.]|nr:zf-HC2 domain-containing protein [Nitrospira sp.]
EGSNPFNCEEVTARLRAYSERELSAQDELKMDNHLDRCEACTAKLNALLDANPRFQMTQHEEAYTLRWLRAAHPLDPEEEREWTEKVLAEAKQIFSTARRPEKEKIHPPPETVSAATERPAPFYEEEKIQLAAETLSDLDKIRERIGAAFVERGPIHLGAYTGELHVYTQNSALLEFKKNGQSTSDLDGKTILFYIVEKSGTTETSRQFSEIIREGIVVVDFTRLGISIEDYARVRFKLYRDTAEVVEGSLGEE